MRKIFPKPFVVINNGKSVLDSKYLPENRTWQAIATIEVTDNRIWASWMSGGLTEPDPLNHIVLSYSDDGGSTWIDPFIVIDIDSIDVRGRDPVLWLNNEKELMFYYGFNQTYLIKISNPSAPIDELIISKEGVVFEHGMILNKPIYYNGYYLAMFDPYDKKRKYSYNLCVKSIDGIVWKKQGKLKSKSANKWFQEGTFIEKKDGSLFALTRIEQANDGGLEESYSYDGGKKWTLMKNNLSYPFYGPGSKCNLRRLKSGNILFINNNSNTNKRKNLSAYLSTDEGNTWYDLLIDYRLGCAYPDVTEDNNGNIYVIFDSGRKTRNEICFTKFKEEDIVASKYVSEGNIRLKTISKNNKYRDIIKVKLIDEKTIKLYLEDNSVFQLNGVFENVLINNKTHTLFNLGEELENNFITDPIGLLLDLK